MANHEKGKDVYDNMHAYMMHELHGLASFICYPVWIICICIQLRATAMESCFTPELPVEHNCRLN